MSTAHTSLFICRIFLLTAGFALNFSTSEAQDAVDIASTKKAACCKSGSACADYAYQCPDCRVCPPITCYCWNGKGSDMFDCSGLTWWAHKHSIAPFDLPHGSGAQEAHPPLIDVPITGPFQRGDLLFFDTRKKPQFSGIPQTTTHVGLYYGREGQVDFMIHAEEEATGIVKSSISSGYYLERLKSVKRRPTPLTSCPDNDLAITWGAATNEIISGAATAANGDIYVCATASGSRLLLSRFDKTGALVWSKSYTFGVVVNPSSLTVAPDGNVIVSAYIETRYVDGLLMKVDPDGNKVWATTWGSGAWDPGGKHVTDAQGNTYQHISSTGRAGAIDGVLLKYDAAGNLKWQRGWYRNINNSDFEIALDKDGNVLLSGFTGGWTDPSGQDLQVQKWDPDGNLLWDRVWVGAGTEHGTALTADEVGNVYVGGFTTSFGLGGDDCFVMKFSPTGSPLWQKAWGKSGTDQLESICVGPDGVIYAVGTTTSFGNGNDLLLLRYATDGSMLSEQIWSTGGNEQATAIHGSADGCFLIGGSAPHCSGTWTDVVGTGGTPSGTFLSNQGSVVTPVGTSMAVAPTIASYAGVQCSGGGGQDGLILAFQGPGKPTNSAQAIVIEQAQSPQGKVLEGDVPSMFEMVNYPNPFNAATEISYSLASDSHVKIEVYDILGRRVAVLTDERQSAGPHRITWTGNDSFGRGLASGVYFYRLSAGGSVQAKKMVLLK